jgi:hypothetical protein
VQTAINNEIAHAADGDIITIPTGTCTWTGSTPVTGTFTKSVMIQGAGAVSATTGGAGTTGTDQTVIINHLPGNLPAMSFGTVAGKSFRVTGIAFLEDSGSLNQRYSGSLNVDGKSTAVRVDHCHFAMVVGGSKALRFGGSINGVADHIYITTTQAVTIAFVVENGATWGTDTGGYGNGSWADGDHFGTSQFMFIEDSRVQGGYWNDCSRGGRYVTRRSTMVGVNSVEHGTHDQYRSCRGSEIYQNTVSGSPAGVYPMDGGALGTNGGTHLLWGNAVSGKKNIISIGYYRIDGATYGISPAPPNGFGMCGTLHGPSSWDQNSSSNGYACLDVPSRGQGDLLTNYVSGFSDILNSTTGTRASPRQARSPIYIWNNTLDNNGGNNMIGNTVPILTDNVDFYNQFGPSANSGSFNGTIGVGQGSVAPTTAGAYTGAPNCTAGPGGNTPGVGWWNTSNNTLYVCTATNTWTTYYTPYTYPHPLTLSSSSSSSGTTVAPPTGLTATVQ